MTPLTNLHANRGDQYCLRIHIVYTFETTKPKAVGTAHR